MRLALLLAAVSTLAMNLDAFQTVSQKQPLLLTDQRMKRLKRDRERQTQRWLNFESRIKNVPDSPERGFELALYYRVTNDDALPAEAERWLRSHPCDHRQAAFVKNIIPGLYMPAATVPACLADKSGPLATMRDSFLENAAEKPAGEDFTFDSNRFLALLKHTSLSDANEIYAAVEILIASGRSQANSVREQDSQFFNSLPVQFLLSLKPLQVDHPDWKVHVAALALIALDPNSDSAQFLQGWAIEDRQMIQEGLGVAYEFLWADPYLPGVGYQNLDPWWYDEPNARLLGRTGWSSDACSISIMPGSVKSDQCPAGWQARRMEIGHLSLIPMTEPCVQLAPRPNNAFVILWAMPPNGRLKRTEEGKSLLQQVDRAGMWRVPSNISGKICTLK